MTYHNSQSVQKSKVARHHKVVFEDTVQRIYVYRLIRQPGCEQNVLSLRLHPKVYKNSLPAFLCIIFRKEFIFYVIGVAP